MPDADGDAGREKSFAASKTIQRKIKVKLLTKAVTTGASLVAGLIGAKIIGSIWKGATGEEPPTPANPEVQQRATIGKVLAFAIISGASAAVIQVITKRWTQKLADKS